MTEIQTQVKKACAVRIYKEGKEREYLAGTKQFEDVLAAWDEMTKQALPMPAFGVSLDALTREERKKGTWAEFLFTEEQGEELPFERLLVQCEPQFCGFNLIRYTQGGYNGRCYYLDLNGGDMSALCECLANLDELSN